MKITFLDRSTIGPSVDIVHPCVNYEWQEYDRTSLEHVAERITDSDIVITNKAPIGAEQLATASKLKMISVAATGYDVIDLKACRQAGVTVSNVRGYAGNTVPEHTFSLILALRRSILAYRQDVVDGEWQKADQFCFFNHPIKDLAGSRIGILGEGVIGQSVARIAHAFGMEPVFASHKGVTGQGPLYTPWEEVLETSDVITCHAPLMPATHHMISTPEFEAMKRKPLLINTSRGGLVDEAALVKALDNGLIAGAGFDVLSQEPPHPDNPLLKVLEYPNFILTPHVAWASHEAMTEVWRQTVEAVEKFAEGSPVRVLT